MPNWNFHCLLSYCCVRLRKFRLWLLSSLTRGSFKQQLCLWASRCFFSLMLNRARSFFACCVLQRPDSLADFHWTHSSLATFCAGKPEAGPDAPGGVTPVPAGDTPVCTALRSVAWFCCQGHAGSCLACHLPSPVALTLQR